MARLLILAHAPLASAFKAVGTHAFPEQGEALLALDVLPDAAPEASEQRARGLIEALPPEPEGLELLILTDAFGATPSNIAQRLGDLGQVKIVTGLNLPMLWRAMNYAGEPLDRLVARAVAGASQGVMQVANARPQNQAQSVGPRSRDDLQAHHHQQ